MSRGRLSNEICLKIKWVFAFVRWNLHRFKRDFKLLFDFNFKLASITTPMYRCPEQLDLWSNYVIGTKSDIWALGCVVYYVCFQRHPFEDSAKLRIVNANFTLPGDSRYVCFHDIIKGCLQIDPNKRFDASMVLDRLGAISETKGWPLKGPIKLKVSGKRILRWDRIECTVYWSSFLYSNRENQLKPHQIWRQIQAPCIPLTILNLTKVTMVRTVCRIGHRHLGQRQPMPNSHQIVMFLHHGQ